MRLVSCDIFFFITQIIDKQTEIENEKRQIELDKVNLEKSVEGLEHQLTGSEIESRTEKENVNIYSKVVRD